MDRKLSLIVQFAAVDKLSGTLRNLAGLGERDTTVLKNMRREAKGLATDLKAASGNVTELRDKEKALERQIERQQRLVSINNQTSRMHAQADRYKSAGMDNMMGGAMMAAPVVIAAKAAMDFSSGMEDLRQKAELSTAEMVRMKGQIIAAARASHQLPEDMRAAVDVMAGLGMDPQDAARLAGPIGQLGTAFKVELADGAAAAYANFNTLKIPIEQATAAFDIMANSANKGGFEVKDMAKWFPTLAAQMAGMSQTGLGAVTDLSAALQIVRRGAGNADAAATNLTDLLSKINASVTAHAFKKHFGIDLPSALKQAYAEGKTPLQAIIALTKKATGGDLSKIGLAFSNQEAAQAIRQLILDEQDYIAMGKDLAKSKDTVTRAFAAREANDASAQWHAFTGRLQESAIVMGDKLLPVLLPVLDNVTGMIGAVTDLAGAYPKATGALATMIAFMAGGRMAFGLLQFAAGSVLKPLATAWRLYRTWQAAATIAEAFPLIASAIGMMSTAFATLTAVMAANPIIAGIMLTIGVLALLYVYWDKVVAFFKAGWTMVSGIDWGGLGLKVVQGIAWGLGFGWKAVTTWPHEAARRLWAALSEAVQAVPWRDIGLFIVKGLASGITGVGGLFAGLARKIIGADWGKLGAAASADFRQGQSAATISGKRAMGGPVGAGRTYLVGERGPELFRPRSGGTIVPNHALRGSNDNGGGVTIHIGTIVQQPGEDADALARRIAAMIEARQRNRRLGAYRDG